MRQMIKIYFAANLFFLCPLFINYYFVLLKFSLALVKWTFFLKLRCFFCYLIKWLFVSANLWSFLEAYIHLYECNCGTGRFSSHFLPSFHFSFRLLTPSLLCPRCHLDFLADHGLLSSASLTSVILFTLPFLSNWSNFPPWLWWMCPALLPCPSTLAGLIKENIPWLPIFPRAWQPIILPSTWLESYYA